MKLSGNWFVKRLTIPIEMSSMLRSCLTILMLVPAIVMAQGNWQSVGDAEDGSTYYLETDTVVKTKKGGRAWTLVSLTAPRDGFLSAKTLFEFDCKSHKHHVIDMAFYDAAMGQGNQIKNVVIPKTVWVSTDPNTTEGAYLEIACDLLRPH
jgi:hypothetical protein